MKLTIFNGSPRGKKSNSSILASYLYAGFLHASEKNEYELHYLHQTNNSPENAEIFFNSEFTIFILPLYCDSMPFCVKHFIEHIYINRKKNKGKKVGVVIQSGFIESIHSEGLSAYFHELARQLKWDFLGVVIKGGIEGMQVRPNSMTRNVKSKFYDLGLHLGKTYQFDKSIQKALAQPKKLSFIQRFGVKMAGYTGIINFYWNMLLKKNGAKKHKYDQPLIKPN